MIRDAVARGRAAAERRMTDACVIRRKTGETTDPFSGVVTPVYTQVYSGPCEVQSADTQGHAVDVGEDAFVLLRRVLKVPVTVTGVEVGDEVVMTRSADPDLLARELLVRDLGHKTHGTARRLGIEERS